MTLRRILALSAVIALAFAVTTPAEAQFGKLLNKAKKAVKEKVENKAREVKNKAEKAARDAVDDAVDGAVGKAAEKAGVQGVSSLSDEESNRYDYEGIKGLYKKDLKPSAAAVAADPKASATTVEQNYTKSPAQIRGAWENLDQELFPYQPYYEKENIAYYDPDSKTAVVVYYKICDLLKEADRPFGQKGLMAEFVEYKDGTVVPIVDLLLTPYFAEFFADPKSYVAYNHFVRARIAQYAFPTQIKMNMKDDMKYTATMGDGSSVNLFEKEHDRLARWRQVGHKGWELACSVTPIETIGGAINNAINRYKKFEAEGNTKQMIITSRELQLMMEEHLQGHNDYETRKKDFEPLLRAYEPIKDKYRDLLQSVYDESAPTVAMPKGVSVSAALQNVTNAEGKKQWGVNFVKAIFLTSNWREFKNPKYPYNVMTRTMDVDFITKEGDNYFVNHWVLKEGVSGGKGTGTYSINARMKQPVKEKVNYK